MVNQEQSGRVTLRTIRGWVKNKQRFAMLTCYDATTASWLWQGGVKCMLVGDTAAQVILGHDSTLNAKMPFMVEITAAVRRGAPDAFVMADMPFGSYQCGDDLAVSNAIRFLTQGSADAVKLEVSDAHLPLVSRLSEAGVPVVAHIGSRPQQVRAQGGYGPVGQTKAQGQALVATAKAMVESGATMLLVEAVPAQVSAKIVEAVDSATASTDRAVVPIIGCGAGPACHGHVVVMQDLFGLSAWQPPFAKPMADIGSQIKSAAGAWVDLVESGQYLAKDHPYQMEP